MRSKGSLCPNWKNTDFKKGFLSWKGPPLEVPSPLDSSNTSGTSVQVQQHRATGKATPRSGFRIPTRGGPSQKALGLRTQGLCQGRGGHGSPGEPAQQAALGVGGPGSSGLSLTRPHPGAQFAQMNHSEMGLVKKLQGQRSVVCLGRGQSQVLCRGGPISAVLLAVWVGAGGGGGEQ